MICRDERPLLHNVYRGERPLLHNLLSVIYHGGGTTVEERERERVKYNTFLSLEIDIKYNK